MNSTKRTWAIGATALLAGVLVTASRPGMSQNGPVDPPVKLQSSTPGMPQIGHLNVSGTAKAAYLKGNGLGVTGINANNVAVGTLSDDRLSTNIPRRSEPNTYTGETTFKNDVVLPDSANLDLQMGHLRIAMPPGAGGGSRVYSDIDNQGAGNMVFFGPSNQTIYLSHMNSYPNNGWLGLFDGDGAVEARVYVDSSAKGVISADIKNFVVPNPKNAAEDIVYASIEGPEAGAYVRGTGHLVNGKAHIELPDHFTDVTVSAGLTVQLTPKSPDSKGVGYWHGSNIGFDVFELNSGRGNYDFDWEVKAVRAGHEDYRPVRAWDDALPAGSRAKQWNARLASIQRSAQVARNKVSNP